MQRRNRAELEGVETSPDGRYIRFDEKLGSGAYKSVWLAYDTDLGIEVAWNTVDLKRLPEKEKIRLKSETDILKNLNHNCIINFYNSWENPDLEQVIFTTEIVTSGTLKQYVSRFKPIKLKVIKKWCRQILQGLCYLHSKNPPIIHRDLKCDNIFINGSSGDIRIGDLGLSTMRNATHAASVLGTPEFMAPELYDEWYTEKVDVYAFGMVVLEMISNEYPYAECTNTAQIFKKVSQGVRPESLNRLQSMTTRSFIELCLAKSNLRLAADDLAKHPFLDPRFVDHRERFPISYDPIVTTTNFSTPLVPVMELAAVAERSQHSMEQQQTTTTIVEEECEHESDVSFLEVILENTVENIARVVLTLDLGNRRKEIKFPFDLDSDTAEAVAIEMVKELGLQQSSVYMLSDGIFAAIKDEKLKWNQTMLLLGQTRMAPPSASFIDNAGAASQQPPLLSPGINANQVPGSLPVPNAVATHTQHHSVPVLSSNLLSAFPNPLASSMKPHSAALVSGAGPLNPPLSANLTPHPPVNIAPAQVSPTGVILNVADASMMDPFTGTPLQSSMGPDTALIFASSDSLTAYPTSLPQPHAFSPGTSSMQFPAQAPVVPVTAFGSSTPSSAYGAAPLSNNSSFPTSIPSSTVPKSVAPGPKTGTASSALDSFLVNVSSVPNLQVAALVTSVAAVAPPSSFASSSSLSPGPSPLISAGSFTQAAPSIPFAAQPPSSFQSATTSSVGAPSSFGNVSYVPPASFSTATLSSLYPNVAAPTLSSQGAPPQQQAHLSPPSQQQAHLSSPSQQQAHLSPPSQQQAHLSPPSQQQAHLSPPSQQQAHLSPPSHQLLGVNATVSQAAVSLPMQGISVPTSQASLTVPLSSSSSPNSQVASLSTSQIGSTHSDLVGDAGQLDPFASVSLTSSQPSVMPSSQTVPRFVKQRSIDELQFPESSSVVAQSNELQSSNLSTSPEGASTNHKPSKNAPDQALDISHFLSGFDISNLSPNQMTTLRDLRSQLDESIRTLKTQYAAMYREAVNRYKMEVVGNLTGWGFPIPPLNLKVQGLGSARGTQTGVPKSVNHLSRRTRDVISLAHGSSNDLVALDLNPAAPTSLRPMNLSAQTMSSQASDNNSSSSSHLDHIYNRLIQPFVPSESAPDPNSVASDVKSATSSNSSMLAGPTGPNWPPKIDTLDPTIWDPSSQSPSL